MFLWKFIFFKNHFQLFDPSLQKKKKSKKTKFDIDAALADGGENIDAPADSNDVSELSKVDDVNDLEENLDLENFGKKKKKKKKPFNVDELENALPTPNETNDLNETIQEGGEEEGGNADEDFNLDLDFSKTKKKKKKKKDLEDLVADKIDDDREEGMGIGEYTSFIICIRIRRLAFI